MLKLGSGNFASSIGCDMRISATYFHMHYESEARSDLMTPHA